MVYTNLYDLFKGICDAIRAKKGTNGAINHQDIPSEIESIETGADVSGVTATASDVKSDKYYVNSSGTLTKGTMPNASIEVVKSSTSGLENFIQVNCTSAGYSTTGVWQYTNPKTLDSDLKAENIKSGVQIFNVTGTLNGGVGYIGNAITTKRSSRTAIYFPLSEGTDNIIGFSIMATEQVDSSTSYDYITAIFNYGDDSMVHYILSDASVFYEKTANGDSLSWAIIDGQLEIIVEDNASGFRGSTNYRCYPIYSKGGIDVST